MPIAVCLLVLGCSSFHHKDKEVGMIRVHIESAASPAKNISVLRGQPVTVSITLDPILTEADLVSARLLESAGGGFAVELKFNETGGWRLEQATAINPGKHLVIFGQWSEKVEDGRWLAAPLIARRNATGMLVFTPDSTHAEAEKLVKGLSAAIKENAKDSQ